MPISTCILLAYTRHSLRILLSVEMLLVFYMYTLLHNIHNIVLYHYKILITCWHKPIYLFSCSFLTLVSKTLILKPDTIKSKLMLISVRSRLCQNKIGMVLTLDWDWFRDNRSLMSIGEYPLYFSNFIKL